MHPDTEEVIVTAKQTEGISHKAVLAFFYPFLGTLVAVATTWIVEGTFDELALKLGIAGLLASGLASLGAYIGRPGDVVTDFAPPRDED